MNELAENILITFNPFSGKRKGAKIAARLEKELAKRGANIGSVLGTDCIESVYGFCKENAGNPANYSMVVIIGGDGTLSHWVDAMIKHGFSLPVYPFGCGTANDFAAYFKTNRSVRKAAKIITTGAKTYVVDTLKINGKDYAIYVAAGGAFTNGVTRYSPWSKRIFGKAAYVFRGILEAFRMKLQSMTFNIDGQEFDLDVYFFLVMNISRVGTMKRIAPLSVPTDGYLNFIAVKKCNVFSMFWMLFMILFGRTHKSKYFLHTTLKSITATVNGEPSKNFALTDIDGNAGSAFPLKVEVQEQKLTVVAP